MISKQHSFHRDDSGNRRPISSIIGLFLASCSIGYNDGPPPLRTAVYTNFNEACSAFEIGEGLYCEQKNSCAKAREIFEIPLDGIVNRELQLSNWKYLIEGHDACEMASTECSKSTQHLVLPDSFSGNASISVSLTDIYGEEFTLPASLEVGYYKKTVDIQAPVLEWLDYIPTMKEYLNRETLPSEYLFANFTFEENGAAIYDLTPICKGTPSWGVTSFLREKETNQIILQITWPWAEVFPLGEDHYHPISVSNYRDAIDACKHDVMLSADHHFSEKNK